MIISDKHKFIFGAIGRSGATSVQAALRTYSDHAGGSIHKHAPLKKAIGVVSDTDKYFKFCVFRNPWELVVSKYFYHGGPKCRGRDGYSGMPRICADARKMSFVDWAAVDEYSFLTYEFPTKTFKEFVSDNNDCLFVNRIYNFKNLNHIEKDLQFLYGIKISIPHKNATKHEDYRKYYAGQDGLIEKIGQRFCWGIRLMGFTFDNKASGREAVDF